MKEFTGNNVIIGMLQFQCLLHLCLFMKIEEQ